MQKTFKFTSEKGRIAETEMTVEIIKTGKQNGSDGDDLYCNVKIIDNSTGKSNYFICRNIFDFGYIINPNYEIEQGIYGGIEVDGWWQIYDKERSWYNVRELTDFEKKAIKYLKEFAPIDTNIRL